MCWGVSYMCNVISKKILPPSKSTTANPNLRNPRINWQVDPWALITHPYFLVAKLILNCSSSQYCTAVGLVGNLLGSKTHRLQRPSREKFSLFPQSSNFSLYFWMEGVYSKTQKIVKQFIRFRYCIQVLKLMDFFTATSFVVAILIAK